MSPSYSNVESVIAHTGYTSPSTRKWMLNR